MGGDEFALIFPDCNDKTVTLKMNSVNKTLSNIKTAYPMSASFGNIEINENSGLTIKEIIEEADKKMYIMKLSHHKVRN